MEKLAVIDYSNSSITIYTLDEELSSIEDSEELLKKLGHNTDECSWMFSEKNIKVEIQ